MSFSQEDFESLVFQMNLRRSRAMHSTGGPRNGVEVGLRLGTEVVDEFSHIDDRLPATPSPPKISGDFTNMLDEENFLEEFCSSETRSPNPALTFASDWTVFPDHDPKESWGTLIDSSVLPSIPAIQPSPSSSSTNLSMSPNYSPFQLLDGFCTCPNSESPNHNNNCIRRSQSYSTAPSTPHTHAFPSPAVQDAVMPSPMTQNLFPSLVSAPNINIFICTYPGCGKKYKTKNNLQRHRRDSKHAPSAPSVIYGTQCISAPSISLMGQPAIEIAVTADTKKYDCPHPECDRKGERAFLRKDNMIQHQRLVHNTPIAKRARGVSKK